MFGSATTGTRMSVGLTTGLTAGTVYWQADLLQRLLF
jgi:hypothetical protein